MSQKRKSLKNGNKALQGFLGLIILVGAVLGLTAFILHFTNKGGCSEGFEQGQMCGRCMDGHGIPSIPCPPGTVCEPTKPAGSAICISEQGKGKELDCCNKNSDCLPGNFCLQEAGPAWAEIGQCVKIPNSCDGLSYNRTPWCKDVKDLPDFPCCKAQKTCSGENRAYFYTGRWADFGATVQCSGDPENACKYSNGKFKSVDGWSNNGEDKDGKLSSEYNDDPVICSTVRGGKGSSCKDNDGCTSGKCCNTGKCSEDDSKCTGLGSTDCSTVCGGKGSSCEDNDGCTSGWCCTGGECPEDSICTELGSTVCSTVCPPHTVWGYQPLTDGSPGSACGADGDCTSAICYNNLCSDGSPGSACGADGDCTSAICYDYKCSDGSHGSACNNPNQCNSGICYNYLCSGSPGDACGGDGDCEGSTHCMQNKCSDGTQGNTCDANWAQGICNAPLFCINNLCEPLLPDHTPCSANNACQSKYCKDSICTPKPPTSCDGLSLDKTPWCDDVSSVPGKYPCCRPHGLLPVCPGANQTYNEGTSAFYTGRWAQSGNMIQCSGDPDEACEYTVWDTKSTPDGWNSGGTDTTGHLSALKENKTHPEEPGPRVPCFK